MEIVKGSVTPSDVIRVKFAQRHFDPDIAKRSAEGRQVEQDLKEQLHRGKEPQCLKGLRLDVIDYHHTLETQMQDGVIIRSKPDIIFFNHRQRLANFVEVKLREEPFEYDILQALVSLMAVSRDRLFGDYQCKYYFYYSGLQYLVLFDPDWLPKNREIVEKICWCTARIVATQNLVDSKPVRRPMQKQPPKRGQISLFSQDVGEAVRSSVNYRTEFETAYKLLTKNWKYRFLEVE